MNILKRKILTRIEGFKSDRLIDILSNRDDIQVDYTVGDSTILTDGTRLKCVREYYATLDGKKAKKCSGNAGCVISLKHFGLLKSVKPFECAYCHINMASKFKDKEVRIIK